MAVDQERGGKTSQTIGLELAWPRERRKEKLKTDAAITGYCPDQMKTSGKGGRQPNVGEAQIPAKVRENRRERRPVGVVQSCDQQQEANKSPSEES